MKKNKLIQYLPLSHYKASMRVVKKLNSIGVMSILDIEDSVQNPFNLDETVHLKRKARNGFLEFVKSKDWNKNELTTPIYIRVNSINTDYFLEDIELVLEIENYGFPIAGIFLPKVEIYDHITKTQNLLNQQKNNTKKLIEVIPMIETVEGVSKLENILITDEKKQSFSKVHYGHFDYCHDAGLWPFPDPNQNLFWDLVLPIAELIFKFKKTYIHTPFPFPNNSRLFWKASNYLQKLFEGQHIWISTLNLELSLSVNTQNDNSIRLEKQNFSTEEKLEEARTIQKNFIATRANKRSFALTNDRFIPPHQYISAVNYLKKHRAK